MNLLKEYFKKRTAKFYILLTGSFICFLASILYWAGYPGNEAIEQYYAPAVPILLLVVSLVVPVMLLWDKLDDLVAPILWCFTLIAFSINIDTAYMYTTTVFFGGVTFDAFMDMEFGFLWPIVFMVITLILSFVAIMLKKTRNEVTENEQK